MNVLVDTSVWSAALRRGKGHDSAVARELAALIGDGEAHLIGPIRQEVLSGVREEAQFIALEAQLALFPDLPIDAADYVEAARCFNRCRARGIQGSNTDFLICAVSIRKRLAIYTMDRDFARFAAHLPIVLHSARD